ncbi:MAG: carbohydrate ABC transporter permease, partial [Butyrivibrio sp.]|nr:carbohydrate ABC transporter permease [Butyrivibrio sp.]
MRAKRITLDTIQLILALIVTVVMAFPVLWMITTAMKSSSELLTTVPRLLPHKPDLTSFLQVWSRIPLLRYLMNTAFVTVVTLTLQVGIGVPAAYGFAKGRFPGRDLLFMLVIGAMMVPEQVTFIPLYTLCARLGWVNTYMGILLPNAISA